MLVIFKCRKQIWEKKTKISNKEKEKDTTGRTCYEKY